MTTIFLTYLLQSSLCLILFVAIYRLLMSNLSHFAWMRFYLMCSLTLSLVLPLVTIPVQWESKITLSESFSAALKIPAQQAESFVNAAPGIIQTSSAFAPLVLTLYSILTVYLIGFVYKLYSFSKNLNTIFGLIKKNSRVKEANYWIVNLKTDVPAFSFFHYIFINENYKDLSTRELELIKNHEIVHAEQNHTLDLLFVELAGILFWFNPLMNYLRKSIQEIHEYIVDERIAGEGENKKTYARLLLSLASQTKVFDFAPAFTGKHIKRRILMIAKQRSPQKHKVMFALLAPLSALLLLSFSYIRHPDPKIQMEAAGSDALTIALKKYCGVYSPSKRDINFGLKPIEILLNDHKLFIQTESDQVNRPIELRVDSDTIFSFNDNSARRIAFERNRKKEITGCAVLNFETRGTSQYLVLKGEYLKDQAGN